MLRGSALAFIALVPLLGCSRPAPPPTEGPATVKLQPKLELVSYLEHDKNVRGVLCHPGGVGPYPAVVMIHDRMGLTDGVKDQTFRLAHDGFIVLAVDLYRGEEAKTAQEAKRLEGELSKERALHDLKAAVDYLSRRSDVRAKSSLAPVRDKETWDLGVLGLGMGGRYALDAALRDPRLHALVMCYSPLPTDAKQLASLQASTFCVLAGKDKRNSPKVIQDFCTAMENAGKRVAGLRVYGACQAGFLDPATWPAHGQPKESDVENAWKVIAEYLNKELM